MTDIIKFDTKEERPNIIKVIGVGGGGSNAVTHMFTEGIQGVDFIVCNTDHQALEKSPVAMKIHLGNRELGAGNVPEKGREAAVETTEQLREILGQDTKMLFITAGMGGGTGTGAAPVVAEIARELDILTVGIVTLPFSFEGKRRQQQALLGIDELRKHVDALLVISNDKLRQEHGDMKLTQAFKKADDVLKTAAKGIAEIITVTGYVNVDFRDVNTIMRNSGKAIMGSGYGEGEDRAMKAVEEAVHSPLLDDSEITGAKNILVYITSGSEEVSLDEVSEITEYVQNATGNCSDVIWGNGEDASLGQGINVTLIATGFNDETAEEKRYFLDEKNCNAKVHDMYDDVTKPKNRPIEEPEVEQQQKIVQEMEPVVEPEIKVIDRRIVEEQTPVVTEEKENKKQVVHSLYNDDDDDNINDANFNDPKPQQNFSSGNNIETAPSVRVYDNPFSNDDDDDMGITSYVKDSHDTQTMMKHQVKSEQKTEMNQHEMLRRQRLSSLNMNFRSMSNIEELENQPAYKRMGINVFGKNSEEQQLSNYSSNKDKGLRESNSFLHDNVD